MASGEKYSIMNNLCQLTVVVKMPACYMLVLHPVERIHMMNYAPEKVILCSLQKRLGCLSAQSNHLGLRSVKEKDKVRAGGDLCKSQVQVISQI